MRPDLLGNRQHGGHQECGPVDSVEPDDVFTDYVNVSWPVAAAFVFGTAHGAEVRGESVKPDIENVRLFSGHRNAPANCGASDAEIFESAFDEANDFVAARFRLDEGRIFFVEIQKWLLEGGKLEEIIFFGDGF